VGDNWQRDVGGLSGLQVDTAHLDNIASYLNKLVTAIRNDLLPYVEDTNGLLAIDTEQGQASALGSQIPHVSDDDGVATRAKGTYTAVHETLKSMADQFDKSATAVQKIANKYSSTEDRNAATAADFQTSVAG
jgi:hypothetical protein